MVRQYMSHRLIRHCLRYTQTGCQIDLNFLQTFDVEGKHVLLQSLKPYPHSLIEITFSRGDFSVNDDVSSFLGLINAALSAFFSGSWPCQWCSDWFLGLINDKKAMMQGWSHVKSLTEQRHDRIQTESQEIATADSYLDLVESRQHGVASDDVISWTTDHPYSLNADGNDIRWNSNQSWVLSWPHYWCR